MTLSTIIMLNIGVATILVAILAAVMLSPTRLRPHFAAGHTLRQKVATAAAHRPRREHDGPEPAWRPVHNV